MRSVSSRSKGSFVSCLSKVPPRFLYSFLSSDGIPSKLAIGVRGSRARGRGVVPGNLRLSARLAVPGGAAPNPEYRRESPFLSLHLPSLWTLFHFISLFLPNSFGRAVLRRTFTYIQSSTPMPHSVRVPVLLLLLACCQLETAQGHGYLSTPRARNLLAEPLGQLCPHCLNAGGLNSTYP